MALDPSIPLQTTGSGQPFAAMSSLLNLKNQQQQVQSGQMANQQSAIDLQERQGVQGVLSNIKNYQDSQGNVDFNKLVPDIMSVAPTTGSQVLGRVAQAQTAATDAHAQVNSLDAASRKSVGEALYSLKGQPPDVVQKTMQGLKTTYPGLSSAVDYLGNYVLAPHANDPKQLDSALDAAGKFVQTAPTQQTMNTPEGVTVNDQASTRVVSQKPGTTVAPGDDLPGTAATLQLPPTAQTMGPDGQTAMIGPHASVAPIDTTGVQGPQRGAILADIARNNPDPSVRAQAGQVAQGGGQFPGAVPTSLPAGQAQNISNNVDEMNRHFASLQDSSSGLQLASSLTGNIKALSHQAITGTDADKLSYVNGLLAHLPGFAGKPETDLKTATDLLEKNMAQLNLSTPASSDAARAMVSIARPHNSMTPDAADEASDQLVGQIKSNMAMRNALQGYKMRGDVQGYQGFKSELEQTADPRIWQLEGKSPQEQKAFMSKLQPQDKAALVQKAQQLHQMGMIQ